MTPFDRASELVRLQHGRPETISLSYLREDSDPASEFIDTVNEIDRMLSDAFKQGRIHYFSRMDCLYEEGDIARATVWKIIWNDR